MTRLPRSAAAFTALLIGAALALAGVLPATAADDDAVSWSVRPANAEGADGRTWVEQTLDPGEQVEEHLALRNLSATAVTFAIKSADGYFTDNGRFNMLPSDTPSTAAGLWIDAPESIVVEGGQTAVVAFTITVPDNAAPGDHAAGIAATVQSVGAGDDGNQVAIESRVGFRVMTRVTGELQPSLAIEPVRFDYQLSWNPFAPGRVTAVYDLVNDGNVRILADPVVASQGSVSAADSDGTVLELLPGDRRQLTATVADVWPLFFAPVQISIDMTVVAPDGEPMAADQVREEFGVWAIPVPQLLVLTGLALVVFAVLVGRRRSRLRVDSLIEQAREAGRLEGKS